MKNANEQAEKTLNSINHIEQPQVTGNFALRVWQRIQEKQQPRLSGFAMLRAAVLAGLLAGINIFTFLHFQHSTDKMNTTANPVAQSFFSNDMQLTSIIK
ncbi:hypothetical protein C7N43_35770 [Sphingobacteriales bacterium UPWRP_1]|nr:hypothetical protein BVG80_00590 [Sphingobacteriales bacterium TSM_CSM]PSJ72136.1 hypothetical protein C7N43_35770 [Sphingobacteriales bacterium UPWRP_1]